MIKTSHDLLELIQIQKNVGVICTHENIDINMWVKHSWLNRKIYILCVLINIHCWQQNCQILVSSHDYISVEIAIGTIYAWG